MKIVSVNIVAFGKLSNVNLQFNDGLNVIAQRNGFGKTTLCNFVRAMLYGFNYANTKLKTKDNVKFAPWNGSGKYGGSMVVEQDGQLYKIERFFGATQRAETLSFVNAKTNEQVSVQSTVGEFLLGLTADSYDRSAYFPQEAVTLSSNENFDSRLANLVQNSNDYDDVQKKLRCYKKDICYEKGNGGYLWELSQRQNNLQSNLQRANANVARSKQIDQRLQQIDEQTNQLLQEQQSLQSKQSQLNVMQAQSKPSVAMQQQQAKLMQLQSKVSRVDKDIAQDMQRCEQLSKQTSVCKQTAPINVKKALPFALVALLLAVAGVVAFVCDVVALGAVCIALCLASVVAVVIKAKGQKRQLATQTQLLQKQYLDVASKYVSVQNVEESEIARALQQFYQEYLADLREIQTLQAICQQPNQENVDVTLQLQQTERQLALAQNQLVQLASERGSLQREQSALDVDVVSVQDELQSVAQQIEEQRYKYRVADVVSQLLERAKSNLSTGYLPDLCNKCSTLVQYVTKDDYNVQIDRNFAISLQHKGVTQPISEFSRGVREIVFLCFRIALSQLLYQSEQIPFVVVDDAFVNYDEDNFVRATQLLATLAQKGQVIYLTCHQRLGLLGK